MKRICVLLAVLSLAMFETSAQANLLDDGSFTLATSGSATSNSDWVLTRNFPDPDNPLDGAAQFNSGFANSENPAAGTGVWFKSFLGERGGDANDPAADADVTQSLVAAVSGDYHLRFRAAAEVNFMADAWGVSLSSSGPAGSVSVDLLTNRPTPAGNIGGLASPNYGGTSYDLVLTGVDAGDTLTVSGFMVQGVDANIPGGQSAFLDRFVLQVPEPMSCALVGLGMLGLLPMRRKT